METIKVNELIAKFMGFELDEKENKYWIDRDERYGYSPERLPYHDRLDWSMEVLQKIAELMNEEEEFIYTYILTPNSIKIFNEQAIEEIVNNQHGGSIEQMIFIALGEFLEYYNKQQEREEEVQEPEVFEIDEDLYEVLDPKHDMKQIIESAKNCKLILFNKETGHTFTTTGSMHNFPDTEKFTLALERNARSKVIIEIKGGMAECWGGHSEVDVEIRDYDVQEEDREDFFNDHNGDTYERRIF